MYTIQPTTEREPGFWLGVPFSGWLESDDIKNGGETQGFQAPRNAGVVTGWKRRRSRAPELAGPYGIRPTNL